MSRRDGGSRKVIIIDNYDSFTYNLVHMVEELTGEEVMVIRNDHLDEIDIEAYTHIILSPGPGIPDEAGDLKKVIRDCGERKKILGVCLGLQAIGEVYGGSLVNLEKVFHGVSTDIFLTDQACPLLTGMKKKFEAGRYHSWVIDRNSIPGDLVITSTDGQGEIMSLRHIRLQVFGVQFHPESIMTPEGKTIIGNFLEL